MESVSHQVKDVHQGAEVERVALGARSRLGL